MAGTVGCLSGCGRMARTRGLCEACYWRVSKRIKSGETTWQRLIELGHALPAKSRTDFWSRRRGRESE